MKTKLKTRILSGTALWANIMEPKPPQKFDTGESKEKYCIDVVVTEKEGKELKGLGFNIKTVTAHKSVDESLVGKPFVRVAIDSIHRPNGIKMFDAKNNEISTTIGNGSKVNVAITEYPHNMGDSTIAAWPNAVQVIELVEYTPCPFKTAEGYTASSPLGSDPLETEDGSPF